MTSRIPTIPFEEVRKFYARKQPNGYWFSPNTMRLFRARLPRVAYETNAGVLFITSEENRSGERRYTVRRQLPNGDIITVGEFQGYPTRAAALAEVKRLHRQGG